MLGTGVSNAWGHSGHSGQAALHPYPVTGAPPVEYPYHIPLALLGALTRQMLCPFELDAEAGGVPSLPQCDSDSHCDPVLKAVPALSGACSLSLALCPVGGLLLCERVCHQPGADHMEPGLNVAHRGYPGDRRLGHVGVHWGMWGWLGHEGGR